MTEKCPKANILILMKFFFNEDYTIISDAAPDWGGSSSNTNPEQTLAASLSSCHMMTFLALAAKAKWPVIAYKDKAYAYIGKNSKGKMCVNKIELNPIFVILAFSQLKLELPIVV